MPQLAESILQTNAEVFRVMQDYEDRMEDDELFDTQTNPAALDSLMGIHELANGPNQQKYYGYQNKKSLAIKPVKMFKDLFSMQKENSEKKAVIRQLQLNNRKLKQEYEEGVSSNQKLENFFKEIEFTFKNDHRLEKIGEVMAKAKKSLFEEAKDTCQEFKRVVKSSQANAIREAKAYLSVLQDEHRRLTAMIEHKKKEVAERQQTQDFNEREGRKYESVCRNVHRMLEEECRRMEEGSEEYLILKMEVSNKLKNKEIEYRKKGLEMQYEQTKELLLKKEGLEYETDLLSRRSKEMPRELVEFGHLQVEIKKKKVLIMGYQKQLREKKKTFDYMQEWTKQLKKKLDDRKTGHQACKQKYEKQINALSEQFEDWNRKYKAELLEEQVAKKKGGTKEPEDVVRQLQMNSAAIKTVKMSDIELIVRKLSLDVLSKGISLKVFIAKKLVCRSKDREVEKQEDISFKEIVLNLERLDVIKDHGGEIGKLARYLVQDNNLAANKIDQNTTIAVSLASLILKKLLETEITPREVNHVQEALKNCLNKLYDNIRVDLRLSLNKNQEFDRSVLMRVMVKHCGEEYSGIRFSQMVQLLIWIHFQVVCVFTLAQFDRMSEMVVGRKLAKQKKKEGDLIVVDSVLDLL